MTVLVNWLLSAWGISLVALAGVLILGRFYLSPSARVRRALRAHRFQTGYAIASKAGRRREVRAFLSKELGLPSDTLREPVLELFDHLVNLDRSAADPRNRFVDREFLTLVKEEVDRAFRALWETCLNLEIVAAQNVRFHQDHLKVLEVAERLGNLSEASEAARVKLAELSLGAGTEDAEDAEVALRVVGRQAEALMVLETA